MTLRYYIMKRFASMVFVTFLLCAGLIFMIDFVELLREAGKRGSVGLGVLIWLGLLRLPAYTEVRSDLISQVLLPGRFSTPENGVVVHIRSRGLDGTLYGLLISDQRKKTHMSYLAERGKVVKQDGGSYLVMEIGHILRGANDFSPREILAFTSYPIDLERFERRTVGHVWKPQERYLNELVYLEDKALMQLGLISTDTPVLQRFVF